MRGLSNRFMHELKNGMLQPVLERVKIDSTLMLGIRDGHINIYYRGGNLLKVTEATPFKAHFDMKFDTSTGHKNYHLLGLPSKFSTAADVERWISAFQRLKEFMDYWYAKHPKSEREFQQLLERENNRSSLSGSTEYFVTDIEFADAALGARFDALAVKWPSTERKNGDHCIPAFIEIKYGDAALGGNSGLIKHINDVYNFLSTMGNRKAITDTMANQFNQLDELGLLKFKHTKKKINITLDGTPEFIILIANHNPRSTKLKTILSNPIFAAYASSSVFDLRFFAGSFAGYGMHGNNMLTYADYYKCL